MQENPSPQPKHRAARFSLSLGATLVAAFLLLEALDVSTTLLFSHVNSERTLIEHGKRMMGEVAEATLTRTRDFLDEAQRAATLSREIVQNGILADDDAERLGKFFHEQLELNDAFAGMYLGRDSGDFTFVTRETVGEDAARGYMAKVIRNGEGTRTVRIEIRDADFRVISARSAPDDPYDPRLRPWYLDARRAGSTVWTEPYVFYTSRQPGVTAAAPVYGPDGAMLGAVGVDVELGAISRFLEELEIGETGWAAILDLAGNVIAFPGGPVSSAAEENTPVRLARVNDLPDPRVALAFRNFMAGNDAGNASKPYFFRYKHAGEQQLAVFISISGMRWPWVVALSAPESHFLGPIAEERARDAYIAVGIALISVVVGLMIARSVQAPLRLLERQASRVARGEYPESLPIESSYSELRRTGNAFLRMAEWLRAYRDETETLNAELEEASHDLTRRVDERTRALSEANQNLRDEIAVREEVEARLGAEVERHRATARDLRFARDEATAASAAKSRFLSNVSHELRTPLNAILGFSELLTKQGADEKTAVKYAGYIYEAGDQLLGLVEQILDLASIEAGKVTLEFVDEDPRPAIAACVEQTRTFAAPRGITITSEVELPPGVLVHSDMARLKQVLLNLMSNAVKYNDENGEVRVRSTLEGAFLRIEVEDTGAGISEPSQAMIFEPFNRAGAELTSAQGTGLGLSLAKDLIERMGGRIGVVSTLGEGSRFWIDVPLAERVPESHRIAGQ